LVLADSLALPESPLTIETLLESALQNRPEAALIRAELALRQGTLTVAERATRPTLSADLTADAWSLDPYSYRQRTAAGNLPLFGVQLRLGFPLGKDGAQQAEIARARAEVAGQEAQREAVHRRIILEVESNLANLTAARTVALRYQDVIVPKAEELYRATRAGYENGLSSLPEVLEAQRTLYQTRREFGSALYHAARAHVLLDAALGTLPKEVTP
jgi:outer membrane protein TolC